MPAPEGVPDGLLRPALELAVVVARQDAGATPAVEPPRPLRPFLRFARLPDQALAGVRRALDEDDGFRRRVAAAADEALLGRTGWLFVARPEGWRAELAALAEDARAHADAAREEREERSARRRVTHAEAATERAEAAAARARAEAEKAAAELAAERRERRAAHDEAAGLRRRAASLESERDSARRRAAEAAAEAAQLRAHVQALEAEARERAEEAAAVVARTEEAAAAPPAPPAPGGAPAAGPDLAAAARSVADAAAAAAALARALGEVSATLAPPAPPFADGGEASPAPSTGGRAGAETNAARRRAAAAPRRRPPPLPPAVFDDTTEAAGHLVRLPGVVLLVDGYNAAKALWPDEPPRELRERLVDALSELHARTGADVHVVFDGADLGASPPRLGARRAVRVSFSPPGVEADDVILDLVDASPLDRPVVVASSDRRVRDGARRRGAGAISSAQLAGALGRS